MPTSTSRPTSWSASQPLSESTGLILGIDPGLARTGYALLADGESVVACGSIKTSPGPAPARLLLIADELASILARFSVQEGALEELFMGRNRTSVIGVAQARGALLLGLARAEVPVFEYKPATVKSILTGYGMADKAQLGRMLSLQLRRGEVPGDNHAADAIAIAVCHARSRRLAVMAR